jgi:RNA polymerase sigma-70 factor (ECF subfamily)
MEPDRRSASRLDATLERALVARARVDASAFGELYDFYLPRIHGFIARRVGDRAVAEDLTATTFERALGAVRRSDFRNDSFGGWLYRVAANAVIDHVRREGRTVPLMGRVGDFDGADAGGDRGTARQLGDDRAAQAFAAALDRDQLGRALTLLPDGHRQILILKFFDGLETDELCAVLGCSRATFAVKLHRALRALRGVMLKEAIDAA